MPSVRPLPLAGLALAAALCASRGARAETVVSLTFDDALSDQVQIDSMLTNAGMHATFYVISGRLGLSGYMTAAQVQTLAAHGHEIGGHTVSHPNLPTLDGDEEKRQICLDRHTLLALGVAPTTFAYPFGAADSTTESAAAFCGYNAARGVGDLTTPTCNTCPAAETIPPLKTFRIRTPNSVITPTTLDEMKGMVTNAEDHGGGWVPMVFHHVCNACNTQSVTASDLQSFVAWLAARSASGTVVRTVHEVIGGDVQPGVDGPPPPPPPSGTTNVLRNASLEDDTNGDGAPDCWLRGGFGTNTAAWKSVKGHTGKVALQVELSNVQSGDAKVVSQQDLGSCAPAAVPGQVFAASVWYQSTTTTRVVAYRRLASGGWVWWAQSPVLPASNNWSQASWTLPPLPSDGVAISLALSITTNGTLTADDFSLELQAPVDSTPPAVQLVQPAMGAVLSGSVALEATATDAVGVTGVDFLVNGLVVASATADAGTNTYRATWNSTSVADGSVLVAARAIDAAGNAATATNAVTVANQSSPNLLTNASLELDSNADGTPDCWKRTGYGTNTFNWARTSNAHAGSWAQKVTITSLTTGDRKLLWGQDGKCTLGATAGRVYDASAWYQSTAPTRLVAYYRDASGAWVWWAQSDLFPASSEWSQMTWTTPPVPSAATAISVGTSLAAVGELTVDDLSFVETPPPPPSTNLLKNASLEASAAKDGTPDCWQRSGSGTSTYAWTRTNDAHDGSWAQRVDVTSLTSGDRKLVSKQDTGACSPAATPGVTYTASVWYRSSANVQLVAYYLDANGKWTWWAQSAAFPASSGWSQATWTTPAFPAGATRISVGVSLRSVGSMTVDDLNLE